MDMNWIDEIRDPEPRKRYIYNADDYDPQYGDPYYREHSTRADSLWRLYEEAARRSRSMPSRTNPVKPITGWRPALCVISSMDPSRRSPRTGTRWEATR